MTVLANKRLIGGVAIALGKDGSGGELLGRGARQRPAGPGSSGGGGLPGCGLGTGSRHGVQSPYVKRVAVGRRPCAARDPPAPTAGCFLDLPLRSASRSSCLPRCPEEAQQPTRAIGQATRRVRGGKYG